MHWETKKFLIAICTLLQWLGTELVIFPRYACKTHQPGSYRGSASIYLVAKGGNKDNLLSLSLGFLINNKNINNTPYKESVT